MQRIVNNAANQKPLSIGILGPGEVGLSLKELYSYNNLEVVVKDKNDDFQFKRLDILNVCIPYTENFIDIVVSEILQSKASLTIVHSTVPIGTTSKINETLNCNFNIVHSPIRGNHPNLTKSLQVFVKYIGSNNPKAIKLATDHFRLFGISLNVCNSYEKTEAAKLLCTTYYGLCIAWHNEMKALCDKHEINFDLIKNWNTTYNKGYLAMGMDKFCRPVLDPPIDNKIGGHCVIPNAEILNSELQSSLITEILKYK